MKKSGFTLINLIILGIVILFIAACRRDDFIHSLVFFTGISMILFATASFFESLAIRAYNRYLASQPTIPTDTDTTDTAQLPE